MRKLDFFWTTNQDWYEWKENGARILKDDAPPEAQASYQHYLEQCKRISEEREKYMD